MPDHPRPTSKDSLHQVARSMEDRWLKWQSHWVGMMVVLLFSLPMLAVIWNVDLRASRVLRESIQNQLMAVARGVAEVIDVDLHASFLERAQEETPAYQQQIQRMERMKQALDGTGMVKYVFTCVFKNNEVRFVLDPTPTGDADGDGQDDKAHIMEVYDDASDTLRAVLLTGTPAVEPEPHRDKWGVFLSAYIPLRDRYYQKVGVVGVDLAMDDYELRLSSLRQVSRLSSLGAISLAIVAGVLMAGYHRRLQNSVTDLIQARDQALAASRAKSQFLAAMSHELRTPMSGVLGMSEILGETQLNTHQREFVNTIRHSGEALLQMITDILDFSQLDLGQIEVKKSNVSLTALMEDLQQYFGPVAQQKDLRLGLFIAPECPAQVTLDGDRLRQILRHLISNAIKFTDEGQVEMHVRQEGDSMLHLSVKDTGVGLSQAQIQLLFQPFAQGDITNTRRHGGMGVGLALCKHLSRALKAELWVESVEGQGSHFHLRIPFEEVPAKKASVETQHIVLHTQDRMTAILVKGFMQKQGHHLRETTTLEALRTEALKTETTLVMVDVRRNDLGGLPRLRSECAAHVRWIGLNAETEDSGFPGCDAVLAMPVTPAALKSLV